MPCAIDFTQGFWYGTLPYPFAFEGDKLLITSMIAVECYKSRAHILFLFEVNSNFYMWQLTVNKV